MAINFSLNTAILTNVKITERAYSAQGNKIQVQKAEGRPNLEDQSWIIW